ncbi:MAG: hypothetical protein IJ445_06945 [Clostridia bacterium]|nr:hypothetical protein [Clostridia bacterium]
MAEYVKHTCKNCIHFKICNDYKYLIEREAKIACADFKSTEDVVPRRRLRKPSKRLRVRYLRRLIKSLRIAIKQNIQKNTTLLCVGLLTK